MKKFENDGPGFWRECLKMAQQANDPGILAKAILDLADRLPAPAPDQLPKPHEGELLGDYRARVNLPGSDTASAGYMRWNGGRWARDEPTHTIAPCISERESAPPEPALTREGKTLLAAWEVMRQAGFPPDGSTLDLRLAETLRSVRAEAYAQGRDEVLMREVRLESECHLATRDRLHEAALEALRAEHAKELTAAKALVCPATDWPILGHTDMIEHLKNRLTATEGEAREYATALEVSRSEAYAQGHADALAQVAVIRKTEAERHEAALQELKKRLEVSCNDHGNAERGWSQAARERTSFERELAEAKVKLEALRLALAPLAAIADAYEKVGGPELIMVGSMALQSRPSPPLLTLAHCLAAREALASTASATAPAAAAIDPNGSCPESKAGHQWTGVYSNAIECKHCQVRKPHS